MSRTVLPNRRRNVSFDLRFGEIDYTISTGRYDDGRIGEVFISGHKAAGSSVANLARDAAVIMSMAIQHDVSIEMLSAAVTRSPDGSPAGLAGAVLDAIVRENSESVVTASPQPPTPEPTPVDALPIGFLTPPLGGPRPRISGEICPTCSGTNMVRTGTCLTCQDCFNSSGGCS